MQCPHSSSVFGLAKTWGEIETYGGLHTLDTVKNGIWARPNGRFTFPRATHFGTPFGTAYEVAALLYIRVTVQPSLACPKAEGVPRIRALKGIVFLKGPVENE